MIGYWTWGTDGLLWGRNYSILLVIVFSIASLGASEAFASTEIPFSYNSYTREIIADNSGFGNSQFFDFLFNFENILYEISKDTINIFN